jgi:hypothetical protein
MKENVLAEYEIKISELYLQLFTNNYDRLTEDEYFTNILYSTVEEMFIDNEVNPDALKNIIELYSYLLKNSKDESLLGLMAQTAK